MPIIKAWLIYVIVLVSISTPIALSEGYFFWAFRIDEAGYSFQTEKVSDFLYREVWAEISAYTSEENQTDSSPFITANMEYVYDGGIACPGRYWFDREVEILGRVYRCNDVMNIRYRNKMFFDIWMGDKSEALQFGRRKMLVKIIL